VVAPQGFIDQGLAFMDDFSNADLAGLDYPLLHLQLFHQHRHHEGLVLVRLVLAARGLEIC